jgi:hypothetical protein
MKKILLYGAIALSLNSFAQIPNYVPTNGLIGWWPFNGNANDESGNVNNGTVNGAILTTDHLGNSNSAYAFDGASDYIELPYSTLWNFGLGDFTLAGWFLSLDGANDNIIRFDNGFNPSSIWGMRVNFLDLEFLCKGTGVAYYPITSNPVSTGNWHQTVMVRSSNSLLIYLDGNLVHTETTPTIADIQSNGTYYPSIGRLGSYNGEYFTGDLDDIGIWNRALNQQEITNLYTSVNCANNTIITPQINSLSIGSAANFTATTSDPSPSFIWQSDLGQGFQSLNDFGNYSGVNTNMLSLANVQLSEHNQEIRAISTSGNCIDTSNVAVINILDTCITNVTVTDTTYIAINDTTFISVTDTLIINAILTGLNPPNNQNTLKVFPNPASTHITIDYGNFSSMGGYTLKITNNLGQVVFTTPINQQSSYIDLSTWSGTGIYFVEIIDTQNNTIENRKILIQ